MKSEAIDHVRSATTPAGFAAAIERLVAERDAAEASRPGADRALQDAIFAGKDEAKARSAIQELDARLITLKAAIDGGKRRQAAAEKKLADDHKANCEKAMRASEAIVSALAKKRAEAIATLRAIQAEMFAAVDDLERKTQAAIIAGFPERNAPNRVAVVSRATGEVSSPITHNGLSAVFAIRADRDLYELATRNLFTPTRERAISDGRSGESRLARAQAFAAIRNQGAG